MISKTFVCPLAALAMGLCLTTSASAQGAERNKPQIDLAVTPAEYDAATDMWTIMAPSVTSVKLHTGVPLAPLFVLVGPSGGRAPSDASEVYDLFPGAKTDVDGSFSAPYPVPAWVAGLEFDLQVFSINLDGTDLISSRRLHLRADSALVPADNAAIE